MHIETDGGTPTTNGGGGGVASQRLDSFENRMERVEASVERIERTVETVAEAVEEPDMGADPRLMEVLPPEKPTTDGWDQWRRMIERNSEQDGHAINGTATEVREALVVCYSDIDQTVIKYTDADIRERLVRLDERTAAVQSGTVGDDPRTRWWLDE